MMRTLTHYNCFGMGGAEVMCCVVGGGMMLGVLEYHLVERSSWVCRLRGELCGKE